MEDLEKLISDVSDDALELCYALGEVTPERELVFREGIRSLVSELLPIANKVAAKMADYAARAKEAHERGDTLVATEIARSAATYYVREIERVRLSLNERLTRLIAEALGEEVLGD